MLRSQGRAGVALAALSLVVFAAPADAEELPNGVNLQLSPNPIAPGWELTVTGNKVSDNCISGRVRVAKGDPLVEYQVGPNRTMAVASWTVQGSKLIGVGGTEKDFEVGEYRVNIECFDPNGTQTVYTTGQTLIVSTNAPSTTSTSTTLATTTSGASTSSTPSTTGGASTTLAGAPSTQGTVEPSTAKPTKTQLILRGGGFADGKVLQIALNSTPMPLGTTTSRDGGFYATSLTLPANAPPGDHQITVSGPDPAGAARVTSAALKVEDLNCPDFTTQELAQAAMGADGSDPHGLDEDKDGRACSAGGKLTNLGTGSSSGGGGGSGGGSAQAASAGGNLPRTGTGSGPLTVMFGVAAVVVGALLAGLSQPGKPVHASHRGRLLRLRRGRAGDAGARRIGRGRSASGRQDP